MILCCLIVNIDAGLEVLPRSRNLFVNKSDGLRSRSVDADDARLDF